MNEAAPNNISLRQFMNHPRNWRENLYVYPVIARRSKGLSIGINLNPDGACNFDCIYCQVDRSLPPRTREVNLAILESELRNVINITRSGKLFEEPEFSDVPVVYRAIRDIAFSGDGEPTASPAFLASVELVARLKVELGLPDVKVVVITDASYLTREPVRQALAIMDGTNGDIWAKLDAGTEAYYQRVNRPNVSLEHIVENIIDAARVRPVVIQSMFMNVEGLPPDEHEITAYCEQLNRILKAGGKIRYVQVYTIARWTTEAYVSPLSNAAVDAIAARITQATGLLTECYYAPANFSRETAPHG